jgi:hypothetical protein
MICIATPTAGQIVVHLAVPVAILALGRDGAGCDGQLGKVRSRDKQDLQGSGTSSSNLICQSRIVFPYVVVLKEADRQERSR